MNNRITVDLRDKPITIEVDDTIRGAKYIVRVKAVYQIPHDTETLSIVSDMSFEPCNVIGVVGKTGVITPLEIGPEIDSDLYFGIFPACEEAAYNYWQEIPDHVKDALFTAAKRVEEWVS